ncbi:hypothetical protein HX870_11905 [Pseudomonas gingeri]|uniref:hypothetical protein n=1 Tax=Pseudomonas gingeri TaxID=117681 RepID=UPI0015A2D943|nr:hypothetical protein [Pseudomonas gingeri]NWD68299.1 hypothetical protein [Pseudomonas gingeri]NWD77868.1 hypothetical protein [Pseudomonas gingeri]
MSIKNIIGRARSLYGESHPTILKADEPTDQSPMELFITDEHTEHYLSFKGGDESARGEITGMIFLMCTIPSVAVIALSIFSENFDNIIFPLLIGGAILPISFIWECRAKFPLPIIFNRRTREIYFDHDGKLFHTPWDNIEAITYDFTVIGPYVGTLKNAALEILVRRLGEPDNVLMVPLGAPMGKDLNMQKGFWEYIRAYMNNGPWFDEHGNHSESEKFIREQLSNDTRPSSLLTHQIKSTLKSKPSNGKKNNIGSTNLILLIGYFFLHPTHLIQDFVYDTAKRRARNRWPEIVLERLRPDGPTTRLIDLERERGLDV